MALVRNYPDVTVDQLLEDIDLGNLNDLIGAVLKIAGFSDPKANRGPADAPSP
jgi:hypothetical protein